MRDFLGRKILVGDTLVYPHRRSSTMVLKKLIITSLSATAIYGTNENGRSIIIRRPDRTVSIPPTPPSGSFGMTYSKE